MTEEYLQYIWRLKRLSKNNLKLTDGRNVEIINFGWHNSDTGPDFFNGQVKIEGIIWTGNIEIHTKASEWYAHKHHYDSAYNNVVLHVVYINDKDVFINGELLPVLELKSLIDLKHYSAYQNIIQNNYWIPCARNIPLDGLSMYQQQTSALIERLTRKSSNLFQSFNNSNQDILQVFHELVFMAFGGRVNKLPFQELALALPYKIIKKEGWELQRIEGLLFGASGLLNEINFTHPYIEVLKREWIFLKHKYNLREMSALSWKFGGTRPHSFPTIKIAQLSVFLFHWKYEFTFNEIKVEDTIKSYKAYLSYNSSAFWKKHYSFKSKAKKEHSTAMSDTAKNIFLINTLVPFYWFISLHRQDDSYRDLSLQILEHLPSENNTIIKNWSKLGVHSKTAFDSQALIELKNQFCDFKQCLSCKIGYSILAAKENENDTKNSVLF